MLSTKDFIPNLERLVARLAVPPDEDPTPAAVDAARDFLSQCGYDVTANPALARAIFTYFGALAERRIRRGLFLAAPPGTGKSLGVSLFAAKYGIPVLTPAQIQHIYTVDSHEDRVIFSTILTSLGNLHGEAQPLVIDELGVSDQLRRFGEVVDLMLEALEIRYRAFCDFGAVTIVTTNLTGREVRERYGLRIEDRFCEMFRFVSVNGRSLRRP